MDVFRTSLPKPRPVKRHPGLTFNVYLMEDCFVYTKQSINTRFLIYARLHGLFIKWSYDPALPRAM